MGNSVKVWSDDNDVMVVAASDGETSGAMVVYYTDKDDMPKKEIKLDLSGGADKYEFYLIDEEHTNEFIGEIKKDETIIMKPNSVAFLINE